PGEGPAAGLERLAGTGSAFVTGSGGLVELDLARYGGTLDVDPGRLVAAQEGVRIEVRRRALAGDELLRVLLGGGRPSLATLTGDGSVLLQSAAAAHPPGRRPTLEQGGSDGIPG
ncbi:MAG TPA: AIM24 family protein, partial [Actinomycetes bacterium]|nr:AIM24 family protein [Actinomycetes bacterium]